MTKVIPSILSLFFLTSTAFAAPEFLVVEGNLIDSAGLPIEESSVVFNLVVLSPGVEQCALYEESHNINMTGSGGVFSLNLGDGTQAGGDYEDVNSLADAFDNNIGLVTPTNCASVGSYNPAAGDKRLLRIEFDRGLGFETLASDMQIGSSAFALSAGSIDGLTSAQLLQVNNGVGFNLDQANLNFVFNDANWTELQALLDGSSGNFTGGSSFSSGVGVTGSADEVQLDVQGNAAQTSNLVEIKNSGATVLASISADGSISAATDLTTKNYVDTQIASSAANYLPLAGATMSGPIDMNTQNIINANNIDLTNDLTVGNDVTVTGAMMANGVSSGTTIAVYNGANYMGFQAPAASTDFVWTLPAADGTSGEVLQTDGSGNLSWVAVGGGAVSTVFGRSGTVVATASDYDANQIDNFAAGSIAATNVQGAIDELDSEKVSKDGDALSGALTMNAANEVRFADGDNSHYVGFKAPANISAAASFVWELPGDDGTAGQVLQTNGSGVLTWVTPSVGSGDILNGGNTEGAAVTIGTNDNFDLHFETNGTTQVTIDSVGNLGIGTSIPGAKLGLNGDMRFFGSTSGYVGFQAPAVAPDVLYTLPNADGTIGQVLQTDGSGVLSWVTVGGGIPASIADDDDDTKIQVEESLNEDIIRFDLAGVETMVLDNQGLSLSIDGNTGGHFIDVASNSPNQAPVLRFNRMRNSIAAPFAVQTTDVLSNIMSNGYDSVGVSTGARIRTIASENWGSTNHGTDMVFETAPNGGGGAMERVRVANNGHVGIGTSTPGSMLHVEGNIWAQQICDEGGANCQDISGGWGAGGDFLANGSVAMSGNLNLNNNHIVGVNGGSSATPGIHFDGDADSGFYNPAPGNIGISVDSIQAVHIAANFTHIQSAVQVVSKGPSVNDGGDILLEAAGGANVSGFRGPDSLAGDLIYKLPSIAPSTNQVLAATAGNDLAWMDVGNVNNGGNSFASPMSLGTTDTEDFQIITDSTPRLNILSTGEVGINTLAPAAKLHIARTTAAPLFKVDGLAGSRSYLDVNDQGFVGVGRPADPSYNDSVQIGNDVAATSIMKVYDSFDTEVLTINDDGKVGIGISSPAAELEVAGIIHADEIEAAINIRTQSLELQSGSCGAGEIGRMSSFGGKPAICVNDGPSGTPTWYVIEKTCPSGWFWAGNAGDPSSLCVSPNFNGGGTSFNGAANFCQGQNNQARFCSRTQLLFARAHSINPVNPTLVSDAMFDGTNMVGYEIDAAASPLAPLGVGDLTTDKNIRCCID